MKKATTEIIKLILGTLIMFSGLSLIVKFTNGLLLIGLILIFAGGGLLIYTGVQDGTKRNRP